MKRLGFAPEAVADLRDIALHIAKNNPDRARSFVAELEQKAVAAQLHPSSFRERSEISPGLRAIGHRRYLIFFRDLDDEVRIVRVIHGARNLPLLFDD